MRCYIVQAPGVKRYASTNADAREVRDQLVEKTGSKKKNITIQQVEVSVSKHELLVFINSLCEESDNVRPD